VSFLIDPPWLYANGRAGARLIEDDRTAAALGAATLAAFWAVSISLYANQRWTAPIAKRCRAEDGRDWMLNSGVFRFDHAHPGRATHAAAAALFASYPLWLWLGWRDGRR
jgi:hypothetical protein